MNCVFAHACYGVILDDEDHDKVNKLLYDWRETNAGSEDEDVAALLEAENNELFDKLSEEDSTLLQELRSKYKCGPQGSLCYTDNDDKHLEEGATPSELWIIGFGVMMFPGVFVPKEFRKTAEWHLWVTGEV